MKHKYFVLHHYFKMTFNNILLRLFRLTSFLFNIIIEIAIMSAKHFMISDLLLAMLEIAFCI